MNILIYLIIALLFAVLIFWTWNNTKDFDDTKQRITFIIFGIIILGIVFIITAIIEINYMKDFQNGIIQMLNNR